MLHPVHTATVGEKDSSSFVWKWGGRLRATKETGETATFQAGPHVSTGKKYRALAVDRDGYSSFVCSWKWFSVTFERLLGPRPTTRPAVAEGPG